MPINPVFKRIYQQIIYKKPFMYYIYNVERFDDIMARPTKKYSLLTKEEIKYIKKTLGITKKEDIDIAILKELKEKLKQIKDKRFKNKCKFKLWDVLNTQKN